MRLVFGLVLLAGIALAGFAVMMAQNYIGAYENALVNERKRAKSALSNVIPTQEIYIAKRAISYGETITADDVMLAAWPSDTLPEDFFDAENPLQSEGQEPRVALRALEKNEAIQAMEVSKPGQEAGLTALLNPGESAFAIRTDVASGVSGFLRPGDRVDVYWTGQARDEDGRRESLTKLIQSRMRLIAIDQKSQTDSTDTIKAETVTVAATREQVAILAQAQKTGLLSLSLLGSADDFALTDDAIEVNQETILGAVEQEAVVDPNCYIWKTVGGERLKLQIPCRD